MTVLRPLLSKDPSLVNTQIWTYGSEEPVSPLNMAVISKWSTALPITKVLLDYGADVNAKDSHGLVALHSLAVHQVALK